MRKNYRLMDRMIILKILEEIDVYFTKYYPGLVRVSLSKGSAIGSVQGEEWVNQVESDIPWTVLTFIQGEKVVTIRITDDEWQKGFVFSDELIDMIREIAYP